MTHSITTHYYRNPSVKKCKLGYKYNKSTTRCKRVIWPLPHTRNIKRCPKGTRRGKKTTTCVPNHYIKPMVIK